MNLFFVLLIHHMETLPNEILLYIINATIKNHSYGKTVYIRLISKKFKWLFDNVINKGALNAPIGAVIHSYRKILYVKLSTIMDDFINNTKHVMSDTAQHFNITYTIKSPKFDIINLTMWQFDEIIGIFDIKPLNKYIQFTCINHGEKISTVDMTIGHDSELDFYMYFAWTYISNISTHIIKKLKYYIKLYNKTLLQYKY